MNSITLNTGHGETDEVAVGDFLSELLVTDTIVWEVTKITPKTVTVRSTTNGETIKNDHRGGNPYPVSYTEALANPEGRIKTLRVRKDGSIRNGSHARVSALYPTPRINGKPASRTDYSF